MSQKSENQCFYLGKPYPLQAKVDTSVQKVTVDFNGEAFICTSPIVGEVDCNEALISYYRKACKKIIEQRLKYYQPQFNVKYKSFAIETDPTKWGTCSSKRHLTFHWKLACFPIEAIDYVVIHELCHLIHMNHDRSFWRLLGKVCPDYKRLMTLLGTEKTRSL